MDKYQALFAFYEQHKARPFEWGKTDCALLAADWVYLYQGVDFAHSFRGHYRTRIGSQRALKKHGFESLFDVVADALGEPLSQPTLAQRGDIVIVDTDIGDAVGIVDGIGVMVQGSEAIEHVEHRDIKAAWRVK